LLICTLIENATVETLIPGVEMQYLFVYMLPLAAADSRKSSKQE